MPRLKAWSKRKFPSTEEEDRQCPFKSFIAWTVCIRGALVFLPVLCQAGAVNAAFQLGCLHNGTRLERWAFSAFRNMWMYFFFLGMSEATRGEDDEKRGGHKVSGGFFAGCITYVLSSKTQNKCSFADESECSIVSSSHRICPRQFTTLNVFLEFFMHFFGVYVKCLSTLQKGAQRVI